MEDFRFWPQLQLRKKIPLSCPPHRSWVAYFELGHGKDSLLFKLWSSCKWWDTGLQTWWVTINRQCYFLLYFWWNRSSKIQVDGSGTSAWFCNSLLLLTTLQNYLEADILGYQTRMHFNLRLLEARSRWDRGVPMLPVTQPGALEPCRLQRAAAPNPAQQGELHPAPCVLQSTPAHRGLCCLCSSRALHSHTTLVLLTE